jgi:hypothetical protein
MAIEETESTKIYGGEASGTGGPALSPPTLCVKYQTCDLNLAFDGTTSLVRYNSLMRKGKEGVEIALPG